MGAKIFFFFFFLSTTEKGSGGFPGEQVTGLVLKELVWIRRRVKERFCWLSSPLPLQLKSGDGGRRRLVGRTRKFRTYNSGP